MSALAIVGLAAALLLPPLLTVEAWGPMLLDRLRAMRAWWGLGSAGRRRRRRAERTARRLLRTCLDDESWAMYRDLGFVRVWGRAGRAPAPPGRRPAPGVAYAFLVYPLRPYAVYLPQTTTLLGEVHVEFASEDPSLPLPPSDDVLAHWMALTGDEAGVVAAARIEPPGSALSARRMRRDLWRLREWERERSEQQVVGEPAAERRYGRATG